MYEVLQKCVRNLKFASLMIAYQRINFNILKHQLHMEHMELMFQCVQGNDSGLPNTLNTDLWVYQLNFSRISLPM